MVLVMSWNLHSIIFSNLSGPERQALLQAIKEVAHIRQGQEIEDLPDLVQGQGKGYQEMGTVYLEPETGRLIMVTPGRSGAGPEPQN